MCWKLQNPRGKLGAQKKLGVMEKNNEVSNEKDKIMKQLKYDVLKFWLLNLE